MLLLWVKSDFFGSWWLRFNQFSWHFLIKNFKVCGLSKTCTERSDGDDRRRNPALPLKHKCNPGEKHTECTRKQNLKHVMPTFHQQKISDYLQRKLSTCCIVASTICTSCIKSLANYLRFSFRRYKELKSSISFFSFIVQTITWELKKFSTFILLRRN